MNPQSKADAYAPKWRHFHPQATVWVHNPFDHDVVFQVADEHNNPYQYRMPAGKTSELPGGAVATLGVKAIVDEMIQNDPKDVYSVHEAGVRQKYEDKIILRIKEAPAIENRVHRGEVNLSVSDDAIEDADDSEQVKVDAPAFPDAGTAFDDEPKTPSVAVSNAMQDIAAGSLPSNNVIVNEE